MAKINRTSIFIVEDEPSYAKAIHHSLSRKEYDNIKVFNDGESCLDNIHLNPEIVLLDYDLGEEKMNGIQVLKKIKDKNPKTQVVFLTANENIEIATNTIKSGAYDYVVKNEAAPERIRNVLKRIIFENQIKNENRALRRGQKIIFVAIVLLSISLLGLVLFNFMNL